MSNTDRSRRKTVYLANSYGFSSQQRELLLPQIVEALEALGIEVWEPFQRNNQEDLSQPGWAYRVGQADFDDVRNADAIFAVVNGVPPDEGVMVELGMAIALGKPTFLFRDDFRRATDSEDYPLNLMLFTGLPRERWQDYYYLSIAELGAADKALARWVAGRTTGACLIREKPARLSRAALRLISWEVHRAGKTSNRPAALARA